MIKRFGNHPITRILVKRRLFACRSFHSSLNKSLDISTRPNIDSSFTTGQPTHETRPHYLPRPGYLTPGITAEEYFERRCILASKLPSNSIAILVGNTVTYSSGSVFNEFQQDNDLYYMTGWVEPNSAAIIVRGNSVDNVDLIMFVPEKDSFSQKWDGDRSGTDGAVNFFNADSAHDVTEIARHLSKLINSTDYIFWDDKSTSTRSSSIASSFSSFFSKSPKGQTNDRTQKTIEQIVKNSNKHVKSLSNLIVEQREIKSDSEIDVMHAAGTISSRAINKAIAKVGSESPLYTEKSLAKYLEYEFVIGGCDRQAYIPVVASGKNALTIHYTRNDDLLYRDETVFIDAGGKLGGYCADISRAWPNSTNGFTEAQKDIYQAVLNVNKKCIDLCHTGNGHSIHDIHDQSVTFITEELRNLTGFSNINESIVSREFYPHYIGHHLGLDLHDVPTASRFKKLVPGNVITIEPGIYVPFDSKWPKWYQGIGVRVEDDIVVGKTSNDILNLTSQCVKEIVDIESLIRSGKVSTPGAYDEVVLLDI